jgi:hypothetical protein
MVERDGAGQQHRSRPEAD